MFSGLSAMLVLPAVLAALGLLPAQEHWCCCEKAAPGHAVRTIMEETPGGRVAR